MLVRPGRKPVSGDINKFYLDDYNCILGDPVESSKQVLTDMIEGILSFAKKHRRSITLYFHNMARFDGIILLRHLALYHNDLYIAPIIRNSTIGIYSRSGKRKRLMKSRHRRSLPEHRTNQNLSFCSWN